MCRVTQQQQQQQEEKEEQQQQEEQEGQQEERRKSADPLPMSAHFARGDALEDHPTSPGVVEDWQHGRYQCGADADAEAVLRQQEAVLRQREQELEKDQREHDDFMSDLAAERAERAEREERHARNKALVVAYEQQKHEELTNYRSAEADYFGLSNHRLQQQQQQQRHEQQRQQQQPLPAGWRAATLASGRVYYYPVRSPTEVVYSMDEVESRAKAGAVADEEVQEVPGTPTSGSDDDLSIGESAQMTAERAYYQRPPRKRIRCKLSSDEEEEEVLVAESPVV